MSATPSSGSAASSTAPTTAASDFALDAEKLDIGGAVRAYMGKIKTGDLGAVPALLSIAVLTAIFGLARPETFTTRRNFANLLQQASPIAVIAMAVSFVLLLGEIDLAAGFTAGVTAAVLADRLVKGTSFPLAIVIAAVVAILLGVFTGYLVSKIGIPSFVVTLANFLSFQGILLLITKEGGSIRFNNDAIFAIMNSNLPVAASWALTAVLIVLFAVSVLRKQLAPGTTAPMAVAIAKIVAAAAIGIIFTALLTPNRNFPGAPKQLKGIPYAVPLVILLVVVLTFILTRTAYGRHLYAVGGNAEAAKRAGINVPRIRMSAFVACAVLAGIGGAFLASQVNSVSPQTGGNQTLLLAVGAAVIGGTSLFGGKGRMLNAVLGGLVLALIDNGLGLVGQSRILGRDINFSDAGIKFIVSGLVLLLAASVDALSRKRG
jgi:D-xylose transport system permease protein